MAKKKKLTKDTIEITVIVDTNDGDHQTAINAINQTKLDYLMPLFNAIKKFKSYRSTKKGVSEWVHHNNYPYGETCRDDLGEKTPQELYPDIDEEVFALFEDNFCPSGNEYGFHTMVSIEICPLVKKEKLI